VESNLCCLTLDPSGTRTFITESVADETSALFKDLAASTSLFLIDAVFSAIDRVSLEADFGLPSVDPADFDWRAGFFFAAPARVEGVFFLVLTVFGSGNCSGMVTSGISGCSAIGTGAIAAG
jgi:hypothetical protein